MYKWSPGPAFGIEKTPPLQQRQQNFVLSLFALRIREFQRACNAASLIRRGGHEDTQFVAIERALGASFRVSEERASHFFLLSRVRDGIWPSNSSMKARTLSAVA